MLIANLVTRGRLLDRNRRTFACMWDKRSPRLSFYPVGGGESFGHVFFGTGDAAGAQGRSEKPGPARTKRRRARAVGRRRPAEDQRSHPNTTRRVGADPLRPENTRRPGRSRTGGTSAEVNGAASGRKSRHVCKGLPSRTPKRLLIRCATHSLMPSYLRGGLSAVGIVDAGSSRGSARQSAGAPINVIAALALDQRLSEIPPRLPCRHCPYQPP